jgi:predicted lipid-binding transport protein (Tim44 family)
MGGGRSLGKQREMINPQQATPRAPAPPPQQAAPAQQPQSAAGVPAKQPSGASRWLGPLAGLAIGAGLASLFMGNGFGGALAGLLVIALIVFGAIALLRLFRGRGRAPQQPLRYAAAGAYGQTEPTLSPQPSAPPSSAPIGAAPHSVAATTSGSGAVVSRWPADFDAEEFLRHARANFMKLQEAHDRRDIAAIRDFLTPELARDIEADMRANVGVMQRTDVVTLNAEVLDVAQEDGLYVVSVRFSGLIREEPGTEPQPFNEIWHLEKPINGRSGWQVAGIQQA